MPAMRALDERLGVGPAGRKLLRYVFPDHWSFMLGEIALYSFVVLVLTGVFLTFFYTASDSTVVYRGAYDPLYGASMGEQFRSVLQISFDVPAGLLIRQTHHWAANVFIVAIVLHALRILLTGAYRKPREINYWVGVTMVALALLEGFLGYSLVDDLLSGMGLVIAYSVALAIPFVGDDLTFLIWGGEYPGTGAFWPRLEIAHVLVFPVLIAGLIGIHLAQIMRQHHTQFRGDGGSEKKVLGTPTWPGYALRSLGLFGIVAGVLLLLGGLVQVNPIWEWGPYETWLSTNGAQPDWYLGWLIGGLRLMPPLELQAGGYTIVPTPFWGGILFPTIVFVVLYAWPFIGRRFFDGPGRHNLLDRPRDNPTRTAAVLALTAWVFTIFAAGAADRFFLRSFISYEAQVWFFRGMAFLLPVIIFFVSRGDRRRVERPGDPPATGLTVAHRPPQRGRRIR